MSWRRSKMPTNIKVRRVAYVALLCSINLTCRSVSHRVLSLVYEEYELWICRAINSRCILFLESFDRTFFCLHGICAFL